MSGNDSTIGGQIQMLVSSLVQPYPGSDPTLHIPVVLRATADQKEFFLKSVLGAFMILRTPRLERDEAAPEERFTFAREALAAAIATHWGKKIDPDKLEQKPYAWEWLAELKLGYNPEKLPKAKKIKKIKQQQPQQSPQPPVEEAVDSTVETMNTEAANETSGEVDLDALFSDDAFAEYD
ncbi:MAG: hypothetical protein DRJ03_12000 [Chloroflexi bacterium]|nr:MAG: hypothetical protein DRJ03_12000 [Chloroflexota bacterium]